MAFVRIDPAHPVVWRSPHALQIGGHPALVILDPITRSEERMLAAVQAGIPAEALPVVGECGSGEALAFLRRIRPALAAERPARTTVVLRIGSASREEIARSARLLDLLEPGPARRPSVGVIVADHVVPPRAYRDWVREGVDHLAVVFGARSATVGPLVRPGRTGCLRCADLRRRDGDPAWPAVAAQLLAMPAAAAADPILRTEALCAAARIANAIGSGASSADVPIDPHPECGCVGEARLAG